jgi:DNA replication protein DnaC
VDRHESIVIVGATGAGKTFGAGALAQAAIRRRHIALYLRAPPMLTDLTVARADGRLPRLMNSRARVEALVIDDLALQPLTNRGRPTS